MPHLEDLSKVERGLLSLVRLIVHVSRNASARAIYLVNDVIWGFLNLLNYGRGGFVYLYVYLLRGLVLTSGFINLRLYLYGSLVYLHLYVYWGYFLVTSGLLVALCFFQYFNTGFHGGFFWFFFISGGLYA